MVRGLDYGRLDFRLHMWSGILKTTLTTGGLDSKRGTSSGMKNPPTTQRITRVSRHMKARRSDVYNALLDRDAVASWLAPGTMRCVVHEFDPHEGGPFRMSLIYQDPADGPGGKTTENTDTFHGHFVRLVPEVQVVQVVEFESEQPGMSGKMRVIWDLADAEDGTEVTAVCEDIPRGIRLEDNEAGSASSLQKLARLVESRSETTNVG